MKRQLVASLCGGSIVGIIAVIANAVPLTPVLEESVQIAPAFSGPAPLGRAVGGSGATLALASTRTQLRTTAVGLPGRNEDADSPLSNTTVAWKAKPPSSEPPLQAPPASTFAVAQDSSSRTVARFRF